MNITIIYLTIDLLKANGRNPSLEGGLKSN